MRFPSYLFTENILRKTQEMAFLSPSIWKIFRGSIRPEPSSGSPTFLSVRTPWKPRATPLPRGGGGELPMTAYGGGSARKGYLFQASGIWNGRDFTSWRILEGRFPPSPKGSEETANDLGRLRIRPRNLWPPKENLGDKEVLVCSNTYILGTWIFQVKGTRVFHFLRTQHMFCMFVLCIHNLWLL